MIVLKVSFVHLPVSVKTGKGNLSPTYSEFLYENLTESIMCETEICTAGRY